VKTKRGWFFQQNSSRILRILELKNPPKEGFFQTAGQIIANSHDLTPNGGLVGEIFYFREIWVGEI